MSKTKICWWKPWTWSLRKPKKDQNEEQTTTDNRGVDCNNHGTEESQNDHLKPEVSDEANLESEKQDPVVEETDLSIDELYQTFYPYDNANLTRREKFVKIVKQWELKSEAPEKLKEICQLTGKDEIDVVSYVKALVDNSPCQESADAESELYDRMLDNLKSRISNKKGLSRLLENAYKEKKDDGAKAVLTKFVQLLTSQYKEGSQSPISGGSVEVDKKFFDEHKQSIMGLLLAELRSDKYNCPCPALDANHPDKCIGIIASNLQENIEEKVREYLSIDDEAIETFKDLITPWFVRKINGSTSLSAEDDRIGEKSPEGVVAYIVNAIINAKRYKEKCDRLENERKSAAGTTSSPVVDKPQQPVETGSESHNDQEVEDLKTQINKLNRQIEDNRKAANLEKKDLEKKANEANKKVSEVVKELQSLIKQDTAEGQAASETSEDKEATPAQLLKTYTSQVESEKKELTDEKDKLERKCGELETEKDTLTNEKSAVEASLKEKESVLNGEAKALTEALREGADRVEAALNAPVATSCNGADDDFVSQAEEIDDRLKSSLKGWLENLKAVKPEGDAKPEDVRKQIQEALLNAFEAKGDPAGTLCRYFAYSRMPFMTDPDRDESGIMFYRKNVFALYKAVEDLYVRFGINFDLPPLFAMGIDEGDYGRAEGAEPDLNNLCPNCTNHRDNMDTHNKPQSMVYDIAEVGYSVDGKQVKKTGVITF